MVHRLWYNHAMSRQGFRKHTGGTGKEVVVVIDTSAAMEKIDTNGRSLMDIGKDLANIVIGTLTHLDKVIIF